LILDDICCKRQDAYAPEKNFFLAFTSGFTMRHALNIALDIFDSVIDECNTANHHVDNTILPCDGLEDVRDSLSGGMSLIPSDLIDTGVTPLDPDREGCGIQDAASPKRAEIDLGCYAYLSISPLADNKLDAIGLDIERGIQFAGRLNLFGKFEAVGKGKVRPADATDDLLITANK
jgi:hypothetical protein